MILWFNLNQLLSLTFQQIQTNIGRPLNGQISFGLERKRSRLHQRGPTATAKKKNRLLLAPWQCEVTKCTVASSLLCQLGAFLTHRATTAPPSPRSKTDDSCLRNCPNSATCTRKKVRRPIESCRDGLALTSCVPGTLFSTHRAPKFCCYSAP